MLPTERVMESTGAKDYRIAAVDRALMVLEALAERPDQGVTQLARRLGLTKTIVFRLLQTLEARGFVARDPRGATYALGYRMSILGERAGRQRGLLAAAAGPMDALRDATSENVNLVVREDRHSLVLATRAGRHAIRLFAEAGRRGPLHAGGGSQLLLAFAPVELREAVLAGELPVFTPFTQTDPEKLARVLERIRAVGYNVALNDLDEGAFSVAAPVRGEGGEVVAAVSVAGAVVRLDEERRQAYLAAALESAAEISRRLAGMGTTGLEPDRNQAA
jgi:IclR family KDG regulon transcriptional repressor